jgi:predicted GIY-YIG superfamily endonuclease
MKVDKIDKKEYDSKLYYGRLNTLSKDNNRYDQFNISKENSHKGGVYKIQLDNKIYIGKTNNFQVRFRSHWDGNGRTKLTQELLFNGGIFSIIETLDDEDERIQKESIYIDKYKKR